MPSRATVSAQDTRELTDVITRLRRALRRAIRDEYPWEQRPVAQMEVLQTLDERGSMRVGDLAERLRLAQSTVSALVGKLIGAGLVVREADPQDRRAAVVTLTSGGRETVTQWDAAHRTRLDRALKRLADEDRAAVLEAVDALGHLVDALDDAD